MRFCGNCGSRLGDPLSADPALANSFAVIHHPGPGPNAELLARFQQASLEASGQHRNVTVLFVDLSGYTQLSERIDNELLFELMQQFLRLLANDVYKYDGMVDKFTGDGLMALFGTPISHENNAELALRAAFDMQTDVAHFSEDVKERVGVELRLHIGLNSGSVIFGGIGSNKMMNYTAIGDTVNLAQRLGDAAAAGTILASESVYRQTKALFSFEPALIHQLKGISKPVKCYPVKGIKDKPGSVRGVEGLRAPMIGRDEEFLRLKNAADLLIEKNQGSFVLITGEAGIGKSRMKAELKRYLVQSNLNIWEGQSLTYRRTVAYWIFLDAIRNFLGVVPDTPESQLREKLVEKVSQLLGARAQEVLPYLEHLLSLSPIDNAVAERIRYLDAGQLRQQVFLAVRDLLLAVSRQAPLLFILEDLHWADQASIDLLQYLLDMVRQAPVLFMAISRPFQDLTSKNVFDWANQHLGEHFCSINLEGLSPEQSECLLLQLLELQEFPPSLRDQILPRAAGVPFYLEEILRMLIDQGIVHRQDDSWAVESAQDMSSLGVPDNLEGLIMARFDRLTEGQRQILQVGSVIGRQFSLPVLSHVLRQINLEMLQEALSFLVDREFILPLSDAPQSEFSFRHVLMSDAVYKTILRREQSEMHGQIGEAIEAVYANRLEVHVEILARHYSFSPRHERALHYLILAGKKSARSYANDQARQHYEQALDLLSKVDHSTAQIIEVHRGLGDVLVFTGEYLLARRHYQAALDEICTDDRVDLAEQNSILLRNIGTTYERQGDYDRALICLDNAKGALDKHNLPAPIERAHICNDTGWILFRRGNVDESAQILTEGLNLVVDTNRYDVIASIYNRLGGVYYQKDQLDQASNYVRKSLVLREEMGDMVAVARSFNNLGLLGWRKGDWDRALENFTRSVDLHASLGDIEGMIQLHSNIGLLLTDKGELEKAKYHLDESLKGALQTGHSFMEGMAYHHLSRYWLAAHQWEKSLDYSRRALKVFAEIGAQEYLFDLYASLGEAWLGLGSTDEATKATSNALILFEDNNNSSVIMGKGRILRLLGNIAFIQGEFEASAQYLRESLADLNGPGNQLEMGRTLVAMARLARTRSDLSAYRLYLNEARLIFRQLGAKLDLSSVNDLAGIQL